MNSWQWIRRPPRWAWALAGVFVVGIVVAAVLLWRGSGDDLAAPATSTTAEQSTTTATPTTTVPTMTTTLPTITTPAPTAASRKTTTTTRPGPVPGAVVAAAHPSGGSGEVQVDWNAVPTATGYRVLRTNTDGGQARVLADIDITTGRTTAAPEVVYLASRDHAYVPDYGPLTSIDQSPWFQYIDYTDGQRCYRVLAYNAAGNGPLSAVACSYPPGGGPAPSGSTPPPTH